MAEKKMSSKKAKAKTVAESSLKTEGQAQKKSVPIVGTVVSDKMDKTAVVQIMRLVKHPLYGKYMRHYSRMYVHDADNQCREGDIVKIKQSRPVSKSKRWVLLEIVRRSEHLDANLDLDANSVA